MAHREGPLDELSACSLRQAQGKYFDKLRTRPSTGPSAGSGQALRLILDILGIRLGQAHLLFS